MATRRETSYTSLGLIKLQRLLREKKRRGELAAQKERDELTAQKERHEGLADRDEAPTTASLCPVSHLPLPVDHYPTTLPSSKEKAEAGRKANKSGEPIIPKKDLPEVTPEAKKKAADANARGKEAFKRNDFTAAIDAYTQAIEFDPTDGTLFSNRSLCWIRMGQAERALSDAKVCRELRPDWAKACYREGAALSLLQRFQEAANAFYDGMQIDPKDEMLLTGFKNAFGAGRYFHGTNTKNSSSSKS